MKDDFTEKKLIGLLIGYYRKELLQLKKDDKYRKLNFISYKSDKIQEDCLNCNNMKCKNSNKICSFNTISALESGAITRKICCYIDFADKLKLQFKLNKKMINEYEELEKDIVNALKINDVNQYLKLYKLTERYQKENENVIYFSELYKLYSCILKIKVSEEYPDDSFINLLEFILPYLKDKTKYLSTYVLYKYYFTHNDLYGKEAIYLNALRKMDPENIEFLVYDKMQTNSLLEAYNFISTISLDCLNDYEKYTIYQFLGYMCLCFNQIDEGIVYVKKSKLIIENSEITFPRKEANHTYMRLGLFYFQLKKYNKAVENFERVFKYDPNTLILNILLYFNSLEKMKRFEELTTLLEEVDLQKIRRHKPIFIYYRMKYIYKSNNKDLEEYIVDNIKPLIPKNDTYQGVLIEELIHLANSTGDYKVLFNYLLPN